jgi:glucokinase
MIKQMARQKTELYHKKDASVSNNQSNSKPKTDQAYGTCTIGIDLGGTKIAGLALVNGSVLTRAVIPTEAHLGVDAVLQRIAGLARDLAGDRGIEAVGVGVPATVDYATGQVLIMPNLPGEWSGKAIPCLLGDILGVPVSIINDARAFTLAESTLGAGQGYPVVVGVTLGTGIGGGITVDGRLILGRDGSAGEVGHHTIDLHGAPDGTGTPGGWEGLASGPAIAAMGAKAVMQGITTRIGELVNFDLNLITPRIIAQAASEGDAVALDILDRAGTTIAAGIANLITILNPHCIVIGGGVAQLGDLIMNPVRAALPRYARVTPPDHVEIVPAALGSDAGAIGAAVWAQQRIKSV